jgi:hypothetical protein
LKTTKTLDASAVRDALLQLLGYSLLDYDDKVTIQVTTESRSGEAAREVFLGR